MAKSANLNIRIDPDTKSQAEELFKNFGLTISDAVNAFLHQSILYGGIPFELRIPNKETLEAIEDVRNRRNLVGPFSNTKELMESLNS